MGTYVLKAEAPRSSLVDITVNDIPAKAAVAVFAYKVNMSIFSDDEKNHSRFCTPTSRAWQRWIDAGNEQPEYIIWGEEIYHWPKGFWNFYDYAVDDFKKADSSATVLSESRDPHLNGDFDDYVAAQHI